MSEGDMAVGREVELGEDDLPTRREIDAGHDRGQGQGDVHRDGQLVSIRADHRAERVLEPAHLGEDVLHPYRVRRALSRPHIHVLVQVSAGAGGDRPQRGADQVSLLAEDGELVAIALDVHQPCFSR
jgi:hypothetical protein